jgi:hypothetical protein
VVAMSREYGQFIVWMLAHTLRYEAICGMAIPKTAAMRATDTAVRSMLRPRRGRRSMTGLDSVSGRTAIVGSLAPGPVLPAAAELLGAVTRACLRPRKMGG